MYRLAVFLLALAALPASCLRAQTDHADEKPSTPPAPLPAVYKNYALLPTSISPDGRYGLLYPKYEFSLDMERAQLLLVKLRPFHVVVEISSDIALQHGHNGYAVHWAKDSSAVLVEADAKWGPDKVLLVPVHARQAGEITDLAREVEKLVRPDYKKSKAARFNDYFNFIFESAYLGWKSEIEQSWSISEHGEVNILCFCTDDPKDMESPSWTVQFEGTWNIVQAKFTRQKITHLSSGPGKNAAERKNAAEH